MRDMIKTDLVGSGRPPWYFPLFCAYAEETLWCVCKCRYVVFVQVSIVGLSKTQYNLSVSAELIKTPGFTVQEIVAASTHHVRIHQLQKRIREVRLTIRLGQRKLKLAVKLLRQVGQLPLFWRV